MIPVALLASGTAGLFSASPHVWAAVFALALLSTAFAYLLYFTIIARAGATNASLVTLIVPVSASCSAHCFSPSASNCSTLPAWHSSPSVC